MGRESFEHEVVVKVVGPAEMGGAAGAPHDRPAETGAGQDGEGEAGVGQDGEGEASVEHEEGGACEAGAGASLPGDPSAFEQALASHYEFRQGRGALRWLRAEIEAVDPADLIPDGVDVQRAAATALAVAWRDSAPRRREVFEKQVRRGAYKFALLARLPRLARAAWFVRQGQLRVELVASGARVTRDDLDRAKGLRERMLGVLARGCAGRYEIGAALASRTGGRVARYLARDLELIAGVYGRDDVRPCIERDEHYRSGDAGEALRMIELLRASFGVVQEGEAERLAWLAPRTTALLVRGYGEHARRGRLFFGKLEDVAVTYPSLYTAARSP